MMSVFFFLWMDWSWGKYGKLMGRRVGYLVWICLAQTKNELKISKLISFCSHFAQPIPSSEAYLPGNRRKREYDDHQL